MLLIDPLGRPSAFISPSPVGVAYFCLKSIFKKYSKIRPLGLTLNFALYVAGARIGLASGAYGAPRKTIPNPPARWACAQQCALCLQTHSK